MAHQGRVAWVPPAVSKAGQRTRAGSCSLEEALRPVQGWKDTAALAHSEGTDEQCTLVFSHSLPSYTGTPVCQHFLKTSKQTPHGTLGTG